MNKKEKQLIETRKKFLKVIGNSPAPFYYYFALKEARCSNKLSKFLDNSKELEYRHRLTIRNIAEG